MRRSVRYAFSFHSRLSCALFSEYGTGVRNLRHLATAITQQKLAYEFPYSSFELDTDLNFVLLSEGKAILPVGRWITSSC